VFRDGEDAIQGIKAELVLATVRETDLAADPLFAAVWDHLERATPLRQGEELSLGRFWMDRDESQAVTPVYEVISVSSGALCGCMEGSSIAQSTAFPD
jgi:hypothetical protein